MRLDIYLVENAHAPSRERAKALIMEGIVYINGHKAEKAGVEVVENAKVEVRGKDIPYVSRGGLKLEKALAAFPIHLKGAVCMDVGASTGGFTDCMLQNGAAKVYAVDVGYGQLAWALRCDERVVCMERCNIRKLDPANVPDKLDFFSVDVSFISLKLVFPHMLPLVSGTCEAVCLVKPQFEAGREKVGKKGVVRERATHLEVIQQAMGYAKDNGFTVLGLDYSPIKGPEGNIEFLMHLRRSQSPEVLPAQTAEAVVDAAHSSLAGGTA